MALLGLPFEVWPVQIDETARPGEAAAHLAARLSATKAAAVRQQLVHAGLAESYSLVIGADTVVALQDQIFGKPRDAAEATAMLRQLRGRMHTVHSAVAIVEAASGRAVIHINTSRVWMRAYSDAEIAAYVASGDPLDKAGAYAIQHAGFRPVERLEGCFSSVVGLPLATLARGLAHFGIQLDLAGEVASVCRAWTGHACCLNGHQSSSGGR
ncbi:MAG: septum formation protein Maf [Ardenticatenia bacterium]|jgi:septum formation protein|nr:MAG: septum formation protein Maf [Ardenticatenia bacterium]